ncbi:MAG: peptidylprolyl isomerase [Armatimonadota bacterium]|nr:peptidylprolyl isomerase [Armatimonadota bacterium]MDR5697924.1 peptidylprolyl isomerase [Armatimonadota bacterium]
MRNPLGSLLRNRTAWVASVLALALVVGATVVAVRALRPRSAVAATVNGEPIYTAEVDRYVREIGQQYGIDFTQGEGPKQRKELADSILDQLIDRALILQEARRRNLLASDTDVDARVAEIRGSFPSQADFESALKVRGLSVADLRDRIRFDLTAQKLIAGISQPQVSEAEVRQYFAQNRSTFDQPAQARVRHILVKTESEARIVLARLRAGEDFAAVARELSQDPGSKDQGGELGPIQRGQTVPEFDRAAFSLPVGQISDPVKTSFGYHILQVQERTAAKPATLEGAREQIVRVLTDRKRRAAFEAWLKTAREQAKIVKNI